MQRTQSGFTLVELLVVIAIIGILMGLTIPAVNAAREAARRNQCSVNVKNLALAAVLHENTKRQLPGWIEKFGEFKASATDPSDPDRTGGAIPGHVKVGTWAVALLPNLEAQPTFEHWSEDRYPILSDGTGLPKTVGVSGEGFHSLAAPNLAIFQCPSNPSSLGEYGNNSYIANNGAVPIVIDAAAMPDPEVITFDKSQRKENGAFNAKYIGNSGNTDAHGNSDLGKYTVGPKVSLDDFKDGQGNTALYTENVQAYPWHRAGLIDALSLVIFAEGAEVNYPPSSRYVHGWVWHYEDPKPTSAAQWSNGEPTNVYESHTIDGAVVYPDPADASQNLSKDTYNVAMDGDFVMSVSNADIGRSPADIARPSSAHNGGVNVGFADGAVRYINSNIDYRVYQAMLTTRGKSSDVPWQEFVLTDELE